jgi:DNA-binding transcriptional regulator YiaG
LIREQRSAEYWAGWALAQFQWYSSMSFRSILRRLNFTDILSLYPSHHEADISKFFETAARLIKKQSKESELARIRKMCNLSQSALSRESGVALRSIQMYEQRRKDINKAQVQTVLRLANALGCKLTDLLEKI